MKFTRYHTKSESMYDVMTDDVVTYVRRAKLGQRHADRGPAQVAKRENDGLATWTPVTGFSCDGAGHQAYIVMSNERTISTNVVTMVEEIV